MGVLEEGGKAATGYITALGSQPVLLVQSLIIAGVVFIMYAQGQKSFVEREQLLKSVFEAQAHVRDILSQCIVPPDERNNRKRTDVPDSSGPYASAPPSPPLPPMRPLPENLFTMPP